MRPQRWQPTRLPRPWDSPGKSTGVGCHFFLQCMKVKSESEVALSCPTLSNPMDCSLPGSSVHGIFQARLLEWGAIAFSSDPHRRQPIRLPRPRDSPGKNTGVGCHFLLQEQWPKNASDGYRWAIGLQIIFTDNLTSILFEVVTKEYMLIT